MSVEDPILRIAPIFPVADLNRALDFYGRLGFTVRAYAGGGYGFASLGGVEIHLGVAPPGTAHGSAYLFVDDADRFARAWSVAGAEVHQPQNTPWGRYEGALVDPDGDTIRFG